mmetsp:Transcript_745/g.1060  ORF Transcript_745/g.1060 Transcript_745/m.1060 type:complete len:164 (+) Transcript_745:85-576(+)
MAAKTFSHSLLLLITLVAFAAVVYAALPPGYEDELYCPPGSCLRRKEMPAGWTGSRVAMHECVNDVSGEFVSKPKGWGKNIDAAVKDELISNGHHSNVCKDSTPKKASQKNAPKMPTGLGGLMQVADAESAPSFMKKTGLRGGGSDVCDVTAPSVPFMTLRSA